MKERSAKRKQNFQNQILWSEVFRTDETTKFCSLCGTLLELPDSAPKVICDLCGTSLEIESKLFSSIKKFSFLIK